MRLSQNVRIRFVKALVPLTLLLALLALFTRDHDGVAAQGQTWEWTHWGADEGSTRYAPLDQINAGNFNQLEVMWQWKSHNFGPEPDTTYRTTPIFVNGKLYAVAGHRRTVVCIDPLTGETLWMFREKDNPRWEASTRKNYGKGVAFTRVNGRPVIYVATPGYYLWALDADTGQPLPFFGNNGVVDLHLGLGPYGVHPDRGVMDWGDITTSSAPIVINGVVIVGNSHDRGYFPENRENIPGIVRGYDAETGRMLWRWNPVPQEGEYGNETWGNESWKWTGNVSAWAPLSGDSKLGLVYIPTDTPTNDYYGGSRPGDNLFGTSLVALDVKTGERKWYFQFVRHDIWNYDTPDAPKLLDVTIGGRTVPIIAQATKQGYLYVFNRETGEPIWPMEDRPAPQSDVPGEQTAATQPHPTKPPPFELQGMFEDHLIDFTPALRQQAVEIMNRYRHGPLFTPPSLLKAADGTQGAFAIPGANGGANIPGGAVADPETGWVYVATQRGMGLYGLVPARERYPDGQPWPGWGSPDGKVTSEYVWQPSPGARGPSGPNPKDPPLPLLKPPYASIVAYDLNEGELKWRIPNGETPARIRNHPALKGIDIGNTGQSGHPTIVLTRSLLMYGEGRGSEPNFRAVDKKTGREVGKLQIPAPTSTAPMTFMMNGNQYIVLTVSAGNFPGELVALALPQARPPRMPQ